MSGRSGRFNEIWGDAITPTAVYRRKRPANTSLFATPVGFFRHIINAAAAPRMTPCDAPCSQPTALDPPVFSQCLQRIGRTSRLITATMPHPRAEDQAVSAYGQGADMCKRGHAGVVTVLVRGSYGKDMCLIQSLECAGNEERGPRLSTKAKGGGCNMVLNGKLVTFRRSSLQSPTKPKSSLTTPSKLIVSVLSN